MEKIVFGSTGLCVSRVNIGTGSDGWAGHSQQTDLGIDGLANLLRMAFDRGINFWDSADQYGSHPHIKKALQGLDRREVILVTKVMARQPNQVQRDVDRFLKELGSDYIDVILLHCMTDKKWTTRYAGAMEALDQAKASGKARAVGVSVHGFGALESAVDSHWPQVVMVRINSRGKNMDAAPQKVVPLIERLYHAGRAVYGMKILGAGQLAKDGQEMIEFVLRLGTVHAFTIGMVNTQQLIQNVQWVNELSPRYPLKNPLFV